MKEFHSQIFKEDFSIDDDIHITGTTTALGSLRAFSVTSDKELIVNSNLESTRGSIIANSSLEIGKDLISAKDIEVKGSCVVAGNIKCDKLIKGDKVQFNGSSLKANSIKARTITLGGNIKIQDCLNASESIWITINPRKTEVIINGMIRAPKVTILFFSFFSKLLLLPDILLNKLKKKTRLKRSYFLKNLNIQAQELIIQTLFPPERADIEFVDCNIDSQDIKFVQFKELKPNSYNEI